MDLMCNRQLIMEKKRFGSSLNWIHTMHGSILNPPDPMVSQKKIKHKKINVVAQKGQNVSCPILSIMTYKRRPIIAPPLYNKTLGKEIPINDNKIRK